MLYTNLNHIENVEEYNEIISNNENVVLICGRMGPLCIPVYRIIEELEDKYRHIKFYDMEYDNPQSFFFHTLPEISHLMEIPFIVCYKNSKIVHTTEGLQNQAQLIAILENKFIRSASI